MAHRDARRVPGRPRALQVTLPVELRNSAAVADDGSGAKLPGPALPTRLPLWLIAKGRGQGEGKGRGEAYDSCYD